MTSSDAPRVVWRWGLSLLLVFAICGAMACHRQATSPETVTFSPSPTAPAQTTRTSAPPESRASDETVTPDPPYRPHRLDTFFRALRDAESETQRRRVSILHVGDSHTASDTITGRLRELFQKRFGAAGRGYAQPGDPWSTFRQEQMSYEMSDHWEAHLATDSDSAPPLGAGGMRLVTDHEDAWLTRGTCREYCSGGTSMDGFTIHYLVQKEGGSFEVSIDGEAPTLVDTEGSPEGLGVFRRRLQPGPHEIRVEAKGDGPIALFGIHTSNGADGLEYSSVGLNGATISDWLHTSETIVREEVEQLSPDLLILAFGTNEAYNLYRQRDEPDESLASMTRKIADYQEHFTEILERYRSAAPDAACLVMLPPDLAPIGREDVPCDEKRVAGIRREVCVPRTVQSLPGIVAQQRVAARRAGCSVWSQSHAMGGEGSIAVWQQYTPPLAQGDGIHLTMAGYHTLAEAFFEDLMRTYDIWKSGGQIPLETREIPPEVKILALP